MAHTFSYRYDRLNRLLLGTNGQTGGASMAEEMSYDDRGNIKTLKRDAQAVTTYTYTGNRLTALPGGLTGTYSYDANGNVNKDRTGMTIRYNHLNLPDSVYRGDGSVKVGYLYDALGTKLRKYSNQGRNRDYVAGIEYGPTGIELIHTPDGVALRNSAGSYTYRYNLSDHLGNVRATVYRNPSNNQVEVLQRDDYYPFGKQRVVTAGINNYLYNGKEKQEEFGGQYDYSLVFVSNCIHELTSFGYGARFYDAEIGRWNVIDPLADEFENISPYNYGMNNRILMVDPDGMAADTIRMQEIFINAPKRESVQGVWGNIVHVWNGGN